MPDEDFRVIALCLSLALGLAMGAIRQADWKHKALIRSLLALAVLLVAFAAGWLWIKDMLPRVGAGVGEIAAHPVAWFVAGMFFVAAVLFRRAGPGLTPAASSTHLLEGRLAALEAHLERLAGEVQSALRGLADEQQTGAADLGRSVAGLRDEVKGALADGGAERAAMARRIADLETVVNTRLDDRDALFDRHYHELRSGLDALRTILGGVALPPKSVRFDPTTNDGTITLGAGAFSFSVHFYRQDSGQIGVSKAGTNLKELARVKGAESGATVRLDDQDHTSRDYVVNAGEQFIAENEGGFFMIAKIEGVDFEGRAGADKHEVRFTYRIDVSGQPAVTAI